MNKVFTIILVTAISFLCSCGTGLGVRKRQVKYFDEHFSTTIENKAFNVHGTRYGSPTLLELFEIQNEFPDSVSIKLNYNAELIFTYKVNDTLKAKLFKGQFTKEGYYELFLRNDSKEIPPLIPLIFARYNINRIRLALTIQDDFIIDNMWNEGGHILFLGAGDSGRRQSYFRSARSK